MSSSIQIIPGKVFQMQTPVLKKQPNHLHLRAKNYWISFTSKNESRRAKTTGISDSWKLVTHMVWGGVIAFYRVLFKSFRVIWCACLKEKNL